MNAARALLSSSEGSVVFAKAIKDPALMQYPLRLERVLSTIEERKTYSPVLLEALAWLSTDASVEGKGYFPHAVKLATRTLIQLGKNGSATLVNSFSQENYLKVAVKSEALETIAELKVKDPELIKKLYWLALEAVIDGGRYYTNISSAAGRVLYQLEGERALDKFVEALKDSNWRTSDGAARLFSAYQSPRRKIRC